jgi:mediator of RNA polymerase II transcription subunit 14
MLKAIIEKHAATILATFQLQLQTSHARAVFGSPGVITRITERQ